MIDLNKINHQPPTRSFPAINPGVLASWHGLCQDFELSTTSQWHTETFFLLHFPEIFTVAAAFFFFLKPVHLAFHGGLLPDLAPYNIFTVHNLAHLNSSSPTTYYLGSSAVPPELVSTACPPPNLAHSNS
jgi:hypothetical protein